MMLHGSDHLLRPQLLHGNNRGDTHPTVVELDDK